LTFLNTPVEVNTHKRSSPLFHATAIERAASRLKLPIQKVAASREGLALWWHIDVSWRYVFMMMGKNMNTGCMERAVDRRASLMMTLTVVRVSSN
jgi:hypothetical protein